MAEEQRPIDLAASSLPESGSADSDDLASSCLNKVSRRLIPYMLLLYVVAYLDRINISFAGSPMSKELGFSDEIFGLGAGIFFIGYFLFGVPSNIMVERLGARRWIASIMVVWGFISVSMCLVQDANCFYFLRFLLGVAEAGFFPGMILYLTYWFPRKEHAKAVARFMSAIPLAGVAGGVISSRILEFTAWSMPGWKWLFIITGSPAVFLGFSVLFLLPDRPEQVKWLSSQEKTWLKQEIASSSPAASSSVSSADSSGSADSASREKGVLFDSRVWHCAFIYFSLALGMYGFQLWLPQIIKGFGKIDDAGAALLSAIPAVFQALGMIVIANSSDSSQERHFHLSGSAFLAALALLLCGFCPNPAMALACLSLAAFGIWGTVGPFWAIPTSILRPVQAAAGIGLINSVGNLGGFAGPYLVGFIKERSPHLIYCLGALSFSLLLASVFTLFLRSRKP